MAPMHGSVAPLEFSASGIHVYEEFISLESSAYERQTGDVTTGLVSWTTGVFASTSFWGGRCHRRS